MDNTDDVLSTMTTDGSTDLVMYPNRLTVRHTTVRIYHLSKTSGIMHHIGNAHAILITDRLIRRIDRSAMSKLLRAYRNPVPLGSSLDTIA